MVRQGRQAGGHQDAQRGEPGRDGQTSSLLTVDVWEHVRLVSPAVHAHFLVFMWQFMHDAERLLCGPPAQAYYLDYQVSC